MNELTKNILLWVVIAVVLVSVFKNFSPQSTSQEMSYSNFITAVQQDQIKKVEIEGWDISGEMASGEKFKTVRPY